MTRVWLSSWEWACCGDPFRVGDEIDFGISHRGASEGLATDLGATLAATVDAIESHHEEEYADRLRGTVTAVSAVEMEHIERRELRRPGFGAPPNAIAPAPGEDWPFVGTELGNGIRIGNRPSRFVTTSEAVPGSSRTRRVEGVGLRTTGDTAEATAGEPGEDNAADEPAGEPTERRVWRSSGWLVDVNEG